MIARREREGCREREDVSERVRRESASAYITVALQSVKEVHRKYSGRNSLHIHTSHSRGCIYTIKHCVSMHAYIYIPIEIGADCPLDIGICRKF